MEPELVLLEARQWFQTPAAKVQGRLQPALPAATSLIAPQGGRSSSSGGQDVYKSAPCQASSRITPQTPDSEQDTMLEEKPSQNQIAEKWELRTPPKDSPPPPAYAVDDAPVPDITAAFSHLDLNDSTKPTPDQCIAHLKLLESFQQLREDVAQKDGLFGIKDAFAQKNGSGTLELDPELIKIREKRWAVYVVKAVTRFTRWWHTSIRPDSQFMKQEDIPRSFGPRPDAGSTMCFDKDNLPPLDVIMVWHAYQLNPRDFLEDCTRYGVMKFWQTGLPWATVNACIDNDTFEFVTSSTAIQAFEAKTGNAWNSLDDPPTISLDCPQCRRKNSVKLTRWDLQFAWLESTSPAVRLATGTRVPYKLNGEIMPGGFADKTFEADCSCGLKLDHELFKTQKFRKDMEALRFNDVPMPGTILDLNGTPDATSDLGRYLPLFPNRLILGSKSKPNYLYNKLEATTRVSNGPSRTMSDVRNEIQTALSDRSYRKDVNHSLGSTLQQLEKVAVRRMMSRYWENSSPFALDLVGAVIRQGSFIEKMHSIDWIHSPAANATMKRLITKYERYFSILGAHPMQVAVPTLDVDLAWHTHQLSPPMYYAFSLSRTQKFVDHDDKIEETKLSDAFAWTSKTYQKMFNSVYSECTCWYCEAIRESHNSSVKRVFGGYSELESQLDKLHPSSANPNTSPHISAHNAIKAETDTSRAVREANQAAKLERHYKKAIQHARKRGRNPPSRDEYVYASAWGYPMYMPYYAPYMGDPYVTGGFYPGDPGCANFQTGAAGNCCQGACGGGVAAGACAGNGFGGCAGGAAGGCAGGSGGGGGGCGGGGGGGGGCGGC